MRVLHLHVESCRGRNHNNFVTSASGSQEVLPSPPSPLKGRGVTHRTLVSSNHEWLFHSAVAPLNAYALRGLRDGQSTPPTPRVSRAPSPLPSIRPLNQLRTYERRY